MKEVYIVATEDTEPLGPEAIGEAFETDEVTVELDDAPGSFRLRSAEAEIAVRFEALESPLGWTPELLTGSESAHARLRQARGLYRVAFETPTGSQPTVAVFEALWCVRALLEKREGVLLDVTAFKLHEEEDVRGDHRAGFRHPRPREPARAWRPPRATRRSGCTRTGWRSSAQRDVEIFHLAEADLLPAESFLHELCTDLAFGQGPAARVPMETSDGAGLHAGAVRGGAARDCSACRWRPSRGTRAMFLTVVSPEGRHTTSELLRPYRSRFEQEDPRRTEALATQATRLLPAFKARFQRRGLMEPLTFLVRAPFETHPDGRSDRGEPLAGGALLGGGRASSGKLVDGAAHTTEWRKGAAVEIDEDTVNAVAMGRDGRPLDDEEMQGVLLAERPS